MQQAPPVLDALIVGQGLVGSLLGFCMIEKGLRVQVLDQGHQTSSTRVAAGLINPLLGKRLSLHDDFTLFYQHAQRLYQTIEEKTQCTFLENLDQLRAIDIRQPEHTWSDVLRDPRKQPWTQASAEQHPFDGGEYSVGSVNGTVVVHTTVLLQALQYWLIQHNSYQRRSVDVHAIDYDQRTIIVGKHSAKRIIFCEGAGAANNPLWSNLPWALAKGDILTLAPLPLSRQAYVWGSWLVPGQKETFRLGSTFDWQDLHATPNPVHRENLLSKLNKAMPGLTNIHVLDHQSGIRPSTQNRQVFVGQHPNKTKALIVNGMGSKGCLMAPLHVQQMTDWILQDQVPTVEAACA